MSRNDHAAGASKALNKTITEIMQHLGDESDRPSSNLRRFLRENVGDLAETWFKKRFNRAHREAHKQFEEQGKVSTVLRFKCT